MSGTAIGLGVGVAKEAEVVGVRILDCTGSGTISDTVAALDWVAGAWLCVCVCLCACMCVCVCARARARAWLCCGGGWGAWSGWDACAACSSTCAA